MRREKGITLIALVITIVVMLVLVGVTVTSIINSDLISKAKETGAQTKEASEAEPGQADDLLNSAMGFLDDDLEKLREFFGKGPDVVGWVNNLNANIEPIPDAPTSIKYLGFDDSGEYFAYNGKIYREENYYDFEEDAYNYGSVILKNYSELFTTVAMQGTYVYSWGEADMMFKYNDTQYSLNFGTGTINRYYLKYSNDNTIKLFDYDHDEHDILTSYNPRLWVEGEEVTVTLTQDDLGYYSINVPAEYINKDFRAVLTINGEIVEVNGNLRVISSY